MAQLGDDAREEAVRLVHLRGAPALGRERGLRIGGGRQRIALEQRDVVTSAAEQQTMADLIALHVWFQMRQGQITCPANPAIGIDDQVRPIERTTGEAFIHYVRGKSTQWDKASGVYTMTLTTHWLGDADSWAVGV